MVNLLGFSFKKTLRATSSVTELVQALNELGLVVGKLLTNRRCEACEEVSDKLKDIHTRVEKYVSSVIKLPSTAGKYSVLLKNDFHVLGLFFNLIVAEPHGKLKNTCFFIG